MQALLLPIWRRVTFFLSLWHSFWVFLRHAHMVIRLVSSQIYFTAVQPLATLMSLSFLAGVLVMVQSSERLSVIGGLQPLGNILVFALFREVIPLMVLLVMIGRSVTAVTSEIATMKVQGELRLYQAYGIPVEGLIFFPRVFGPALAVTGLMVMCVLSAYVGAALTAVVQYKINLNEFKLMTVSAIYPFDFLCFLLKATLIPLIVFSIAVYEGAHLKAASFEVPIVTIRSVMNAYISCILMFIAVSILFYSKEGLHF